MNLTTVLTAVSTVAIAGIVAKYGFAEDAKQPQSKEVVAYVGAKKTPVERDIVAELLESHVTVEKAPAEFGSKQFVSGGVTVAEVEAAKRLWQDRLDSAIAVNAISKANDSRRAVRRDAPRPKPKRRAYRPNGSRTDSRLTMFQRATKIRSKATKRTYGLPHRKRTSKRIRTTR